MSVKTYAIAFKNMALLAGKGLDEGLLEQLRQAGPEAAATVRELVNASYYELEALNEAFADSTRVAMESMKRELDPLGVTESAYELIDKIAETILANEAMENALIDKVNASFAAFSSTIYKAGFDYAGYNLVVSAADAVLDGSIRFENACRIVARNGHNAFLDELEISSPSRKGIAAGENYVGSIALGMYSQTGEIEKACSYIAGVVEKNLRVDLPPIAALTIIPYRYSISPPPDPIGLDTDGYGNAFGSQLGFDRFLNLSFNEDEDDNDKPFKAARPIDSINRVSSADIYNNTSGGFHYYGSPITIVGSGLSADELEEILERRLREERVIAQQQHQERQARERRLANV